MQKIREEARRPLFGDLALSLDALRFFLLLRQMTFFLIGL